MKLHCFFVFVLSFVSINGYKVLGFLPFASSSHFAIGDSILKSLLDAGNDVTVVSPYPQKIKKENYHEIDMSMTIEQFKKEQIPDPFTLGDLPPLLTLSFLYKIGADIVNTYMQHPKINDFLNSKEKFDVCIIENFNNEAFFGIADHFDCILISYTTFAAVRWVDEMTSNESPFSYVPHPFLTYTEKMTFTERLQNTVYSLIEGVLYKFYHLRNQRYLYNKYFPNSKKSFDEMFKASAIHFLNNHVSSSSARPYLPNMIEIAGIHVSPAKPLPTDIQNFLDSAKDGVILFSMGSIIQAVQWPLEKRETFIKVFSKLKQKVLWKYENETLPGKPDNVMITPWIPQRDILAHPNVKVFITHGGLLGTTEAMVEGVPVLGIPIFGDQKMNMAKAIARKYGTQILKEDINEENFMNVLKEILENPEYAKNAKTMSQRFIDRPMTPQESVVYWTNYAVRHDGAMHLRAAGNSLSYVEFNLIDVYLTLTIMSLLVIYLIYRTFKFIISRMIKNAKQKVQ